MKTSIKIALVLFFQALLLSFSAQSAEIELTPEEQQWLTDNPIIRLSPDPDFAPIEAIDEAGQYVGMGADYMALIEEKAGIKFTMTPYNSWKKVVEETKLKNIDVLAAITKSTQREEYLNFAPAHIKLPGMIIVSDRISGTITLEDLKDLRVASPAGYVWFDLIGNDHPDIKLLEASNLKAGLRDLSFGVIDAVIADPATVTQVIKEEGLSNLRIGGETGYFFDLAFAVRKDWPILRNILEKSVLSISEEEHKQIFDKWIQFSSEGISKSVLIALLVGFAIIIALAVGFMFINKLLRTQVAKQTLALNEANDRLSNINVELEERVDERTLDLKKAYGQLKSSQVKLVQSEKMASLGQMVAGVAHEINTPLGYTHSNMMVIKDFIGRVKTTESQFSEWKNLMSDEAATEEAISDKFIEVDSAFAELNEDDEIDECRELVDDTLYGIEQISDITQNLKDFSRLDQAASSEVNLNDNIERTLKLAKNQIKDHIRLELVLGDIPRVSCNSSQINQVLLNLITNACQAIVSSGKEKGLLGIESSSDGERVSIEIKDNGIGMSQEIGDKMFDPFYTTKDVGKGTGLGLSICYNIVIKEHRGRIVIRTREGFGTRFIISLRINQEQDSNTSQEALPQADISAV